MLEGFKIFGGYYYIFTHFSMAGQEGRGHDEDDEEQGRGGQEAEEVQGERQEAVRGTGLNSWPTPIPCPSPACRG